MQRKTANAGGSQAKRRFKALPAAQPGFRRRKQLMPEENIQDWRGQIALIGRLLPEKVDELASVMARGGEALSQEQITGRFAQNSGLKRAAWNSGEARRKIEAEIAKAIFHGFEFIAPEFSGLLKSMEPEKQILGLMRNYEQQLRRAGYSSAEHALFQFKAELNKRVIRMAFATGFLASKIEEMAQKYAASPGKASAMRQLCAAAIAKDSLSNLLAGAQLLNGKLNPH